jgi:hypothetical protein
MRSRERGAAMIEGVVVVSTMLVFLGLIVFMRNAYTAKIDLQQRTRSNVLYYASHGCTGEGGTSRFSGLFGDGSAIVDAIVDKITMDEKAAAKRTWNTASASARRRVSWQTVWDQNAEKGEEGIKLRRHNLSRTISAESTVTCNEKVYSNQWTAWYKFAGDFFKRGLGGIGDLFR